MSQSTDAERAKTTSTGEQTLESLLARLDREPSYAAYQRAGRALEALESGARGKYHARVAVLSSSTIEPFSAYLSVEGYRSSIISKLFVAPYERFTEELLDPESRLASFQPEIVFLDIEPGSLLPVVARYGLRLEDVEAVLAGLDTLVTAFGSRSSATIVIHNFVNSDLRPFAIVKPEGEVAYEELNRRLSAIFQNRPNVVVLDVDGLSAYHGRSRSLDPRLRYLAGIKWSESFLPLLAKSYVNVIKASRGLTAKCLVLDLDNTMWGGVVGEVGATGIVLGGSSLGFMYTDFQRAVLGLHHRGILLAISSKNNRDEALAVIREHPNMLLREEHFSSIQIGWDPKPEQVRRIAKELGIGTDSLVFFDDDPVERARMRHELPEVHTVELPKDASEYAALLLAMTEFEPLAVTAEDLRRSEMYAEQRTREAFRAHAKSFEEFLRGLQMAVEIRVDCAEDVDRVAILTQKTNQFNVTARRYLGAEIAAMMASPEVRVYSVRVSDTFGDAGLSGAAIIKGADDTWTIDTFLLSCRSIGREIETVFLGEILRDARDAGASAVLGTYVRTAKNELVENFYFQQGFERQDGTPDGWRCRVEGFSRPREEWLEIRRK